MARPGARGGPPGIRRRPQVFPGPLTSALPPVKFVSNANAPQIVDYTLAAGFGVIFSIAAGPAGGPAGAEYQHGSHAQAIHAAEQQKTQVQESTRGSRPTIGSFVAVVPQQDLTQQSQVFQSVRSPPVVVTAVPAMVQTAPQFAEPNASAIFEVQPVRQGNLGEFVAVAPQQDTTQQSSVWRSVRTPPAASGNLGAFVVAPYENAAQITAYVAEAVLSSSQGPLGEFIQTLPQVDNTPRSSTWAIYAFSSSQPGIGPSVQQYTWGTHAQATHQAETLKSSVFRSVRTPPAPTSGFLGEFIATVSQADNTPSSSVFRPAITQPTSGFLGEFVQTVPQPDLTQRSSVWSSARTPPAATTGALGRFVVANYEDVAQLTAYVAEAVLNGGQGPLGEFVATAPQADPTPNASDVWSPVQARVVAPVLGQFVATLPQVEQRSGVQTFRSAANPQGRTPAFVYGTPQFDPSVQLPAQPTVFPASATPPVAPPNQHRLYIDITTGTLYLRPTANPSQILVRLG